MKVQVEEEYTRTDGSKVRIVGRQRGRLFPFVGIVSPADGNAEFTDHFTESGAAKAWPYLPLAESQEDHMSLDDIRGKLNAADENIDALRDKLHRQQETINALSDRVDTLERFAHAWRHIDQRSPQEEEVPNGSDEPATAAAE